MWPKDRLTRFEVARIIGARALQIFLGAPILIKTNASDPMEIAQEEFKQMKIPITIKRPLPDGTKEVVDIKKAIKNWLQDYPN
ncbi:MAG: DNA-directed RNA polymerase subunit K [Candidatus Aenigmarchaeota archaeon]|nr:DNA-directed RNA polymerase subunit K [Candidatus Aenigmarchaeota archaeon]MCX8179721.1 DNA-directed RNA polymerase subunit K [Candidatus Aenigmarchaeota archaeon]